MPASPKKYQVVVADDHSLLRNALAKLIGSFEDYSILFEAGNGKEIKEQLSKHIIPDIVLLDINMPDMDGYETAQWLHANFPQVKVLALSMFTDENIIIRMLKLGAKGYILKNAEPEELKQALDSVLKKDFYLSEYISGKIVSGLNKDMDRPKDDMVLSEREKELLKYMCSELSYKDIAAKLFISPRTLDDYRNNLFEKTKVKTRVGLAIFAIRNGLVEI